ncbi:MAG: SEC-C metal-binding domain-containing protein [Longimicrobiales bacterium]|nr:SEC-C metal-binding domain-containing protein [Longimicrobiales bacterium]
MNHPGRNDPCPCGSGRKYKRCCGPRDVAADAQMTHAAMRRSAAGGVWSADVVPMPCVIDEAGSERPVAVVVMAGEFVLYHKIRGRLGGDAPAVAEALALGIGKAVEEVERPPDTLFVRHEEVRDALAPLLAPRGIEVRFRAEIPEIRDLARSLMADLGGPPFWPPVARSESWLGWEVAPSLVAELFEAAATFWENAPWRVMENMQAPRCELPSGRAWTSMVLGNGGEEFGLVLHSEHTDAFERPGLEDPDAAFSGVEGRMLSLIFEPLSEMPKRARKEIAIRRWRVADTRACPDLMTVNTPGGGVSEDDVRDMIEILRAMPRFARRHGPDLEREIDTGRPVRLAWTDAESGVVFRYEGEGVTYGVPVPLPVEELGGLTVVQFFRLMAADWSADAPDPEEEDSDEIALRLRNDLTEAELAGVPVHEGIRALIELADELGGLERTQTGNLKVAVVREWIDRVADRVADRVPEWGDLTEIAETRCWESDVPGLFFLRVLAEFGEWLVPRGSRFALTRAGRTLLKPGREGERYARLFELCFREYNLSYDSPFDWAEGQRQVAFTLYRLGEAAAEWATGRELLDRRIVVPFAQECLPGGGRTERGAWTFETHLLRPLGRFGLIERRWDEERVRSTWRVTPRYGRFLEFRV